MNLPYYLSLLINTFVKDYLLLPPFPLLNTQRSLRIVLQGEHVFLYKKNAHN